MPKKNETTPLLRKNKNHILININDKDRELSPATNPSPLENGVSNVRKLFIGPLNVVTIMERQLSGDDFVTSKIIPHAKWLEYLIAVLASAVFGVGYISTYFKNRRSSNKEREASNVDYFEFLLSKLCAKDEPDVLKMLESEKWDELKQLNDHLRENNDRSLGQHSELILTHLLNRVVRHAWEVRFPQHKKTSFQINEVFVVRDDLSIDLTDKFEKYLFSKKDLENPSNTTAVEKKSSSVAHFFNAQLTYVGFAAIVRFIVSSIENYYLTPGSNSQRAAIAGISSFLSINLLCYLQRKNLRDRDFDILAMERKKILDVLKSQVLMICESPDIVEFKKTNSYAHIIKVQRDYKYFLREIYATFASSSAMVLKWRALPNFLLTNLVKFFRDQKNNEKLLWTDPNLFRGVVDCFATSVTGGVLIVKFANWKKNEGVREYKNLKNQIEALAEEKIGVPPHWGLLEINESCAPRHLPEGQLCAVPGKLWSRLAVPFYTGVLDVFNKIGLALSIVTFFIILRSGTAAEPSAEPSDPTHGDLIAIGITIVVLINLMILFYANSLNAEYKQAKDSMLKLMAIQDINEKMDKFLAEPVKSIQEDSSKISASSTEQLALTSSRAMQGQSNQSGCQLVVMAEIHQEDETTPNLPIEPIRTDPSAIHVVSSAGQVKATEVSLSKKDTFSEESPQKNRNLDNGNVRPTAATSGNKYKQNNGFFSSKLEKANASTAGQNSKTATNQSILKHS